MKYPANYSRLCDESSGRILLLDGAMGTMIQKRNLSDDDYKGARFRDIPVVLKGCHDILCLTRPDVISDIHRAYLAAGADIITTNTFNANAISLADYNLSNLAYEIAREGARLAREAADEATNRTPDRPRFVAGTVGPTNRSASISSDIANPAAREITFDELLAAYTAQIEGLIDGGADLILIETVFDTLNAKAALRAVEEISARRGVYIPVMISATLSDAAGHTLSGQTLEAFYTSVSHAPLFSVGLNCGFGPSQLLPFAARLSETAECRVSCHPNAGLPNALGEYDETPEVFAEKIRHFLKEKCVNIIGGCCGTTPDHIREISKFIDSFSPRNIPAKVPALRVSNLEQLTVGAGSNFINIGERTNVAGSAKFARLIREGLFDEAVAIALKQIEAGAQVIDVCMDAPLINGAEAMHTFLNLLAAEPSISRVPVMIDSSDWEVIRAGLKVSQGKCIVNSISLKEGEAAFLAKAKEIQGYGAAAVVMLFDEEGQADTFERKRRVAERSYRLLTDNGFPPEDIIFDPNILTVATGIPEHDRYAVDFIDATRWIKENLPHSHVSGGVSNLSFAFRGQNLIREAMHSVFLYHAIAAGMDMAIVNAQTLKVYSDIDPVLVGLIEDLLFVRNENATEKLLEYARNISAEGDVAAQPADKTDGSDIAVEERIFRLLTRGVSDSLQADIEDALRKYPAAMDVIDRVLMPAMARIGVLFGEGKMFLPQVIKSARVLKQAISILEPHISAGSSAAKLGKVVIATVRGDIHDIGKNIVSLVVGCNGYEVIDLGVMADATAIADEVEKSAPLAVLLSGLITPSLHEMVEVCKELRRRGLSVPVIVGGATTSPLHTALMIAPQYGDGVVIHSADASVNANILAKLSSPERDAFIEEIKTAQADLRSEYRRSRTAAAPSACPGKETGLSPAGAPRTLERIVYKDFDIAEVESLIDWSSFFAAWDMKKRFPEILDDDSYGEQARKLYNDALALLRKIKDEKILTLEAVVRILPAKSVADDIVVRVDGAEAVLPMLRADASAGGECVADFVSPSSDDYVCLFALTAGVGLKDFAEKMRSRGNDYDAILAKLLADRLAEAFAEKIHAAVRTDLWGYDGDAGCRLAFGYSSVPDHSLKRDVFEILGVEQVTDMRIVGNSMISPEESVCGLILPRGRYFSLGKIDEARLADYAWRRKVHVDEIRKYIPFQSTI